MTSSIEQINLGYNQQEDRLLLKVGMADQSELTLWITRKICKDLWHLLQNSHGQLVRRLQTPDKTTAFQDANVLPAPKLVSNNVLKQQAVAAFNQEAAQYKSLEVMDFSTEYAANRTSLSNNPILVVQCTIGLAENQTSHLAFQAQEGEAIKMGLTLELVVALSNMMQLATREAGWDLLMLQNNAALNLLPAEQVLH